MNIMLLYVIITLVRCSMNAIDSMINFNQLIKQDLVVVMAKTHTCSVCGPIALQLDQVMKQYPNIPYYHIYIEEVEEFSGQHLVFTVPTILIFSKDKELLRESRFINFDKIKRLLELYQS